MSGLGRQDTWEPGVPRDQSGQASWEPRCQEDSLWRISCWSKTNLKASGSILGTGWEENAGLLCQLDEERF